MIENVKGGIKKILSASTGPDEKIKVQLNGTAGECLVVTDKKVLVAKAGFSSGALFGQKAKSFPFKQITSVEYSCGLTAGRIQITTAGTVESSSGHRKGVLDSVADTFQAENVVTFPSQKKLVFQKAAALIRQMLDEQHEAPTTATPDILEQIKKLAELKESGILTEDEFNNKKAELLKKL